MKLRERRARCYTVSCALSFVLYAAFLSRGRTVLFSDVLLPRVSLIAGAAALSIIFCVFKPLLGRCRSGFEAAVAGALPATAFILLSASGRSAVTAAAAASICALLFCGLRAVFLAAAGYPRTLATARRCTSLALSFVAPLIALSAAGGALLCLLPGAPAQSAETFPPGPSREELFAEYAGELSALERESWSSLDTEEKLEVLAQVTALESEWLGIPAPKLRTGELAQSVLGQFSCEERAVYLGEEALSAPPLTCLSTLLHELRHAYQYEVVRSVDWSSEAARDNLYWSEARRWRAEQLSYVSGSSEAFEEYYSQSIEEDARSYAGEHLADYAGFVSPGGDES